MTWIVVLENEEGSAPTLVQFDSEEKAKAWAGTVNDMGEVLWPDSFHNYARHPVEPMSPAEATTHVMLEAIQQFQELMEETDKVDEVKSVADALNRLLMMTPANAKT